MFKYTTDDDEDKPSDAVFKNLENCYFGSCVPDLLHFIFSCINQDTRRNFILDFIGNVYFEAFKSAVLSINKNIPMFSKLEISAEIKKFAVSCGFSALEIGLQQQKLERRKSLNDQENILATFRDVLKITNSVNFWNQVKF